MAELRAKLVQRAMFRCEYRLIHEDDGVFPDEVDHIISQ